jgi:hypothetical protein
MSLRFLISCRCLLSLSWCLWLWQRTPLWVLSEGWIERTSACGLTTAVIAAIALIMVGGCVHRLVVRRRFRGEPMNHRETPHTAEQQRGRSEGEQPCRDGGGVTMIVVGYRGHCTEAGCRNLAPLLLRYADTGGGRPITMMRSVILTHSSVSRATKRRGSRSSSASTFGQSVESRGLRAPRSCGEKRISSDSLRQAGDNHDKLLWLDRLGNVHLIAR